MKKLIASCLILSLLGSTASVCFGMNGMDGNEDFPPEYHVEYHLNQAREYVKLCSNDMPSNNNDDDRNRTETISSLEQCINQLGLMSAIFREKAILAIKKIPPNELQPLEGNLEKRKGEIVKSETDASKVKSVNDDNSEGLSTCAKVGVGVGVTAAVALVAAAVITPCVIYRDQIKAWFTGPFVDFFTKTIPGAFSKKTAKAR